MFNEFNAFVERIENVDNIHIQGRLQGGHMISTVGHLDFEDALTTVKQKGYSGPLTIELEGATSNKDALSYIDGLKRHVAWKGFF
jgi:sugar phosphate isomerase/epimerase